MIHRIIAICGTAACRHFGTRPVFANEGPMFSLGPLSFDTLMSMLPDSIRTPSAVSCLRSLSHARLLSGLLVGLLAAALSPAAHAQHPTAMTSIVNSDADTTMEVNYNGSLLMPGTFDFATPDSIPAEGAGTRLMWYPAEAAFRAGNVSGTQWDAGNIGLYSVAFGRDTEASGSAAMAMGGNTTASAANATAMGSGTIANDNSAVAMGFQTTAGNGSDLGGEFAVAMGDNTTASGQSALAMGNLTTASGEVATAMGSRAKAEHSGTFVWADGTLGDFASTGADQFLVQADGGVGLGTNSPQTQLDVGRDVSGGATVGNHVAFLENLATSSGDVLALRSNANQPGAPVNFITFKSASDNIGAVEGNGSGGVEYKSGGGDFAELLPRKRPAEAIEAGDVVAIKGGAVTKATDGAAQVSVVTDRAAVLGNAPGERERARYEKVSFTGQVPVRTRGAVEKGDLLVPSGRADGTARAVAPSSYAPQADGPVVGQAWDSSPGGVQRVNAAVGPLGTTRALRSVVQRQQRRIAALEATLDRIDALESRLATLSAQQSPSLPAGGPVAGGLLAGLALVGAGLLWRRSD